MNVTHMSSIDELKLTQDVQEPLVAVDSTTMLLFYFSIEELAQLTPGEQRLLATVHLEAQDLPEDMQTVGTAEAYQDRIRRRVTKSTSLPNRTTLAHRK